eukprot:8800415-Alexandrium_andersonii.AAC.1
MEDGKPPGSWEEYSLAVFREKRWADGMMLTGASEGGAWLACQASDPADLRRPGQGRCCSGALDYRA